MHRVLRCRRLGRALPDLMSRWAGISWMPKAGPLRVCTHRHAAALAAALKCLARHSARALVAPFCKLAQLVAHLRATAPSAHDTRRAKTAGTRLCRCLHAHHVWVRLCRVIVQTKLHRVCAPTTREFGTRARSCSSRLASTSRPARCRQTRRGSTRSCTAARAAPPAAGPEHARHSGQGQGTAGRCDAPWCRAQPRKASAQPCAPPSHKSACPWPAPRPPAPAKPLRECGAPARGAPGSVPCPPSWH